MLFIPSLSCPFKKSTTSLAALVLAFTLTASCSSKGSDTTKKTTKKTGAEATKKGVEQQTAAPDRGSAEEARTQEDETPDPDTISFDTSANTFVFYDKSIKLKTDAESKIVTLTFTGGFQETSGKVKTTGTVYQGPKCNDKHGSTVTDDQLKLNDFTSDDLQFPRASLPPGKTDRGEGIAPGISECYKHKVFGQEPKVIVPEPWTVTKVLTTAPTSHEKNSDARLGSCKALLAGKTTGHLKLKAKIHADNGKLKIQFWNTADNEPNEEAASEAGLAKIKRALGLKTYSKTQVQELSRLRFNTDITRGAESSPLASSEGDCFKYLYARQLGVNYELTRVSDSPDRYVPPSTSLPSKATIAAHKMLQPKSDDDSRASSKFLSRPSVEVTFSNKKVIIGTKALDQLLKPLDPTIDFAGGSEAEDLQTAMKKLTSALNMNAE